MFRMDIWGEQRPQRGDLLQTNVGDRRERTWIILHTRQVRRRDPRMPERYEIHAARWWELEPETRMRLYKSAERRGGQNVFRFFRYKSGRKTLTFEQLMRMETTRG